MKGRKKIEIKIMFRGNGKVPKTLEVLNYKYFDD